MKLFAGLIQGKGSFRRSGGVPMDIARCLLASALLGTVVAWLDGDMKQIPEQVASWTRRIAYKGFIPILTGLDMEP